MSVAEEARVFEELRPPLSADDAVLEADRCLECGGPYAPAPCLLACPAEVDVPAFVSAIAAGDPHRAARTIWAENLLGGTCARVCPVEVLCEGACVLHHGGRAPIAIAALQRYATDWAFANGVPAREPARLDGHRVAVIGAGPAGLTCAGELAARGVMVTVYDEHDEVGGLVRYGIAPYRQQRDPLPEEFELLRALGVRFELGNPIDEARLRMLESTCDAIFLGVGLGGDADVAIPGDDLAGVWNSLEFVEALKTGSPPEVGESVVVVGGGNTAVDVAVEARRLGADVVALVYRRSEAEMPAYRHEVELAREEGVRLKPLANPVRFLGKDHVEAVECVRMRLGARDESGRRRPRPVAGSEFTISADTVVKAIGQKARDDFLTLIHGLELENGRIVVDARGRTGNAQFYAAGDGVSGGATVVEAVRGAKLAAAAIADALEVAA